MNEKTRKNILKSLIAIDLIGYSIAMLLGEKLDANQVLGSIILEALLFVASLAFFVGAALPYKELTTSDVVLKRAYRFSIFSLILSLLTVPIWSLLSGEFPPGDFGQVSSIVASTILLVALFGPASPWIILWRRWLIETNIKMREQKKRKKS